MYTSKFKWKFPLTPSDRDVYNNESETTDLDYGEKPVFLRSNLKFCYLESQRCLGIKHTFEDVRFDNQESSHLPEKTNTRISLGF